VNAVLYPRGIRHGIGGVNFENYLFLAAGVAQGALLAPFLSHWAGRIVSLLMLLPWIILFLITSTKLPPVDPRGYRHWTRIAFLPRHFRRVCA